MFISVTKLTLKNRWQLFKFFSLVIPIQKQLKKPKGLIYKATKSKSGKVFYTLSAWETEEDMKQFRNSGAHLTAMKNVRKLSNTASYTNFTTDDVPNWGHALKLLNDNEIIRNYK